MKEFLCVIVICLVKYVLLGKKLRNNQTDFSPYIFTLKPYGDTNSYFRNVKVYLGSMVEMYRKLFYYMKLSYKVNRKTVKRTSQ